MKLIDIKERLKPGNKFDSEEQRETILNKLISVCTKITYQTLMGFQHSWDKSKPFSEFAEAQNKVLLQCIEMEQHEIGQVVRKTHKLQPEILEDNYEIHE